MGNHRLETVLQRVRHAWIAQTVSDVTDAELLCRFVHDRDAAAFELLLRRHERMVFCVCRRLMRDDTDAEDVFQTTFLTLVCKAHSIAQGQSVAAWLHRVACRAARRATAQRARRLTVERPTPDLPAVAAENNPLTAALRHELAPALHEELSKLPEKYRAALVLCYLEGKTYAEGARQLGCPLGTLSIRLKRGRDLLRQRLAGRGFVLTAGGLATALSEQAASAAVAAGLVAPTLKAGLHVAGGSALVDVVSPQAAALTEGMLRTMSISKLKLATAALVFTLGVGLAVGGWAATQSTPQAPPEKPAPGEPRRGAAKEPPPGPERAKGEVVVPEGFKFNGLWVAKGSYSDGNKTPDKVAAPLLCEFKGSLFTLKFGGSVTKYGYKIDPSKTPNEIDLTPLNAEDFSPGEAKAIKGIYAFDGDQLKISWFPGERDQKRPRSFAGQPGQWVGHFERGYYPVRIRPKKEPVFVTLKPAAGNSADDAERKLVKARFNLALEALMRRYDEFNGERGSVEALTRSARQLQDARLDLAVTIAEQIKCREEYLEFTRLIEELVQRDAMPRGLLPRLSVDDYKLARMARLEAEIDLLRAQRKAGPAAPK